MAGSCFAQHSPYLKGRPPHVRILTRSRIIVRLGSGAWGLFDLCSHPRAVLVVRGAWLFFVTAQRRCALVVTNTTSLVHRRGARTCGTLVASGCGRRHWYCIVHHLVTPRQLFHRSPRALATLCGSRRVAAGHRVRCDREGSQGCATHATVVLSGRRRGRATVSVLSSSPLRPAQHARSTAATAAVLPELAAVAAAGVPRAAIQTPLLLCLPCCCFRCYRSGLGMGLLLLQLCLIPARQHEHGSVRGVNNAAAGASWRRTRLSGSTP